jgi:hypothetical protein
MPTAAASIHARNDVAEWAEGTIINRVVRMNACELASLLSGGVDESEDVACRTAGQSPNRIVDLHAVRFNINNIKRDHRGFLLALAICTFVGIVVCPSLSSADVADYYVRLSCDAHKKIATIENYIIYEGEERPPKGAELLSTIAKGDKREAAMAFCNIGEKQPILVSSVADPDRPTYDRIDIYTGTRLTPFSVYIADKIINKIIRVSRAGPSHAVYIQICNYYNICQTKLRSDPSFDCRFHNSAVDQLICRSDNLSLLDAATFGNLTSRIIPSRHSKVFVKDPEKWRDSVFSRCSVSGDVNILDCMKYNYASIISYTG